MSTRPVTPERDILSLAHGLGLAGARPLPLARNFNQILRLDPYPVVARVSRVAAPQSQAMADARREIGVASHLAREGIPVITPASIVPSGPYRVGETVVSLWTFLPPTDRPALAAPELVRRATAVQEAMARYPRRLPRLAAWRFSRAAARRLTTVPDPDVRRLHAAWETMDALLERLPLRALQPAHGDLHPGNLLPGPDDWHWCDFEDASLMPAFWDLATLVANAFLFDGPESPLVRAAGAEPRVVRDRDGFLLALKARAILAAVVNTWWASEHQGDRSWAERQLAALFPALERLRAKGL